MAGVARRIATYSETTAFLVLFIAGRGRSGPSEQVSRRRKSGNIGLIRKKQSNSQKWQVVRAVFDDSETMPETRVEAEKR